MVSNDMSQEEMHERHKVRDTIELLARNPEQATAEQVTQIVKSWTELMSAGYNLSTFVVMRAREQNDYTAEYEGMAMWTLIYPIVYVEE